MEARLHRVEVELAVARDHDLAVERRVRRQELADRAQLREVAQQRPPVPRPERELAAVVLEHAAEPVPFRLVPPAALRRELRDELGLHRRERDVRAWRIGHGRASLSAMRRLAAAATARRRRSSPAAAARSTTPCRRTRISPACTSTATSVAFEFKSAPQEVERSLAAARRASPSAAPACRSRSTAARSSSSTSARPRARRSRARRSSSPTRARSGCTGPGPVLEAAKICDFEADLGWAIGVERRVPLHVERGRLDGDDQLRLSAGSLQPGREEALDLAAAARPLEPRAHGLALDDDERRHRLDARSARRGRAAPARRRGRA